MTTTGVSSRRTLAVALSLGFLLAPITFASSNFLDRLSPPEDGADIGAGFVLLLSFAIFVWAVLALLVALVLQKLPRQQMLLVAAVGAGSFVLMALMWSAG